MISATASWNMDGLSALREQSRTVTGAAWRSSARRTGSSKEGLSCHESIKRSEWKGVHSDLFGIRIRFCDRAVGNQEL